MISACLTSMPWPVSWSGVCVRLLVQERAHMHVCVSACLTELPLLGNQKWQQWLSRGEAHCASPCSGAQVAEEHYKDLSSKPFYKDLVNYIISGPVVCMVSGGSVAEQFAFTQLSRAHGVW